MRNRVFLTVVFVLLLRLASSNAQSSATHDSSYYETYPDKLTTRLYLSQKYVRFTLPSSNDNVVKDVEYNANTNLNLGLGATWHNYSLNIFYGFSFLNNKDKAKGETKGLDLQFHFYPRKWAIDLLTVLPKGFYLTPKGYAAANSNSYYYRPDVKMSLVGISAYKVPNKERFSYRAAITQNEWQKKSAGSVLYGGEAFYCIMKGDSALVPKQVENNFPQAGITNVHFLNIGPGIGYAYTLVIAHHFFITASMVGNLDLNLSTEEKPTVTSHQTGIVPSAVYKAGIGYNSSTWNISANLAGSALWSKSATDANNYFLPTGHYRLVLSRKLTIRKHHGT